MERHTRTLTVGVVIALMAGALCVGCSADDPDLSLELRIVQYAPSDDLTKMSMVVWGGERTYYAHDEVLLTEKDVLDAEVVKQDNGAPAVRLVLTEEGREKLLRVTQRNVGSRLGVVIDGRLQCAPPIEAPVRTGMVTVTGHMLESDAKRCSRALTHTAA